MAKTLHSSGTLTTNFVTTPNITYGFLYGYADSDVGDPEATYQVPVRTAGTYSKFTVINVASNVSQPHTVRFRKNGANANQSVSVPANTSGTFTDTSNTDTITAGDLVNVQYDLSSGTGDLDLIYTYATFDTTTSSSLTVSKLVAAAPSGFASMTGASAVYYIPLNGYLATNNTTEANAEFKCQYAGTFKNLACRVRSNSRTTSTTVRFRKNTANGNQTVVYTSTQTGIKEDTTNSDTVAVGDLVNFSISNGTGTQAISWDYLSVEFHTTTNPGTGIQVAYNQTAQSQARNITKYLPITGVNLLTDTESLAQFKMPEAFTIKGIGIKMATNTIASTSTFALRVNGSTTAASVTITSATAGWYQNTTNSVTVAANDLVNFILTSGVGTGSQTMSYRTYGLYVEFAGSTRSLDAIMSDSLTLTQTSTDRSRLLLQINSDNLALADSESRLRLLLQTGSDSLTLTGGSPVNLRGLNQTSSDSITLTHTSTNRLRLLLQTISDSFGISDAVLKAIPGRVRLLSEAMGFASVHNKFSGKNRSRSDSIAFSDTAPVRIRNRIRTVSESISLVETISRLRAAIETISHSLLLSHTNNRLVGRSRTLSGSIGFSHGLSWFATRIRYTSHNINLLSDTVRSRFRIVSTTDTLSFLDSSTRLRNKARILTQSVALSDAFLGLNGFVKLVTDSLAFTDLESRLRGKVKTNIDSIALASTSPSKIRGLVRSLPVFNLQWTENIQKMSTRIRLISSSLSFNHLFTNGSARVKEIYEFLVFQESITKLANKARTSSDSLALSSLLLELRSKLRSLNQSILLVEAISRKTTKFRSFIDNLNFTDLIQTGGAAKVRSFIDSLTLTDSSLRLRNKIKTASSTLTVVEVIIKLRTKIRDMPQSLSLAHSLSRQASRLRSFVDNLNLTDLVERGGANIAKLISQTLNFNHNNIKSTTRLRSITHSLAFNESMLRIRTRLKSLNHSVAFTDLAQQLKVKMVTIQHSLAFIDTRSRIVNRFRAILNSLNFSTDHVRSTTRIRTILQNIALSDTSIQSAISALIRTISEQLSFSDGAYTAAKGKMKMVADTLGLSSTVQKTRPFRVKLINESLTMIDSVSRMRLLVLRGFDQNLILSSTMLKSVKSAIKRYAMKIKRFVKFRYN